MNGECLEVGLGLITLLCLVRLLGVHPRVEESHSVDITIQRLEWLCRGPVLCVAAGSDGHGLGDGLVRDPAAARTKLALCLLLHIALLDRTPGLQDPKHNPTRALISRPASQGGQHSLVAEIPQLEGGVGHAALVRQVLFQGCTALFVVVRRDTAPRQGFLVGQVLRVCDKYGLVCFNEPSRH